MVYFLILFPVAVMFISVLVVYRVSGFSLRNILIALVVSAVVSGAISAASLRFTVINNPTYRVTVRDKLPKSWTQPSSNDKGGTESGGKWSQDFWMSLDKNNKNKSN